MRDNKIRVLSIQRYFNLIRDEIIGLTSGKQKRKKIIFDEKAYLLESRVITVKRHSIAPLERITSVELALSAWEADVLPLNYIRKWRVF